MHFTCRSFIGRPSPFSWSSYWENEPDDARLALDRGHLFGLISFTQSTPRSDIASFGHEIILEVSRLYFSLPDTDPQLRLKATVLKLLSNPLYFVNQLSLCLAVVIHHQLYLAIYHSGQIFLKRDHQFAHLLSGCAGEVVTLTGPLFPEDQIFFCTQDFYNLHTSAHIQKFLALPSIALLEQSITTSLSQFPDQSTAAAVFIQPHFSSENINTPPPPLPVTSLPSSNLFTPKPVYVSSRLPHFFSRRRLNLFFAAAVLILLISGIILGYRRNQAVKTETSYRQLKTELDQKLQQVISTRSQDINSALEVAMGLPSLYDRLYRLNVHRSEVSPLLSQIEQLLAETGSANHFSPEVFYDTRLINQNPNFKQLLIHGSSMYIFDQNFGRIDQIDLDQKSTQNFSLQDSLKNISLINYNSDLFALASNSISLISKDRLDSKYDLTSTIADIQSWNGSFYLLDPTTPAIWKLVPNSSGYTPSSWLKDGQNLVASPLSLSVDGRVWVLGSDGQVQLFDKGIKINFRFQSVSKFPAPKLISASATSDYLAIVDSESYLYLFNKSGELHARYNFGFRKIFNLAFNSKGDTIFVLTSDQKIYKISL